MQGQAELLALVAKLFLQAHRDGFVLLEHSVLQMLQLQEERVLSFPQLDFLRVDRTPLNDVASRILDLG